MPDPIIQLAFLIAMNFIISEWLSMRFRRRVTEEFWGLYDRLERIEMNTSGSDKKIKQEVYSGLILFLNTHKKPGQDRCLVDVENVINFLRNERRKM